MHEGGRLGGRKQPIRGERDHAEPRRRPFECIGDHAAVIARKVEIVHRARVVEIVVGVETLDAGVALLAQIALYLVTGVQREGRVVAALDLTLELTIYTVHLMTYMLTAI